MSRPRGTVRQRLETFYRYQHARRVWLRRSLLGLGGVVALGVVWIVITGLAAQKAAQRAAADLSAARVMVSTHQLQDLPAVTADLTREAAHAHDLTTGPFWFVGAHVPYLGDPMQVVRGAAAVAHRLGTSTVPDLVTLTRQLDPSVLRTGGHTIGLDVFETATPVLDSAEAGLGEATAQLASLPRHTWLRRVDGARSGLADQLSGVAGYVDAADRVARILPVMAGSASPKRYFVGLQNEAEMRGTGGIPGAFAILVADKGRLTFTHFESDQALLPAATDQQIHTDLEFGSDFDNQWAASDPTSLYVNSNVSPNFPYAAQIWASMWQKVSGEHIDGALALDPTMLSYFLAVTGPATLPGGVVVSDANVVSLTERDEYTLYPDVAQRKDFLVALIKAVDGKVIAGAGNAQSLVEAAATGGTQHRLLAWSADPAIEALLGQTSFGGVIPVTTQPFSGLVVTNIAAGKLDYYLRRTVRYQRTGCGPTRDVLVTVTLTNDAPASGLPAYVTTRLDDHPGRVSPGDNRLFADLIATSGAALDSVDLNGRPSTAAVNALNGHPEYRLDVELPRGQTQTLEFHLREPAGTAPPQIWSQPGVNPLESSVFDQPC